MIEPISISLLVGGLIVKHGPDLLHTFQDTLLNKGKELAIEKGKERLHAYTDEKEHLRHLELALQNAVERGITAFQTLEERDQYRSVLRVLLASSPQSAALRREAASLFTLSDSPNLAALSEKYNLSQRIHALAEHTVHTEVDLNPYLCSFFEALIAELYLDPLFRPQVSDVLRDRASAVLPRSLTEIIETLHHIQETIADTYTPEQFEQDVADYIEHVEQGYETLALRGFVPKDHGIENTDPELNAIFIPLRISLQDRTSFVDQVPDSLVQLLDQTTCLVVLGGPGSGKSTATRHLAWSHAAINRNPEQASLANVPLLSGHPLPLSIELRRLSDDRRQRPDYNFLTYAAEVPLGRSGQHIDPRMFELLLERHAMVLLFDGLDEVASLDERSTLIAEIQSFARHYPGNRILVTSRPVGYDLARFSERRFAHAHILAFDNAQIQAFIERWYAHVLHLSPLPPEDQQELEILCTTLQENPRLHRLAENPLLLTVITALHRYERLSDHRVQVYDRCADLLLDTWARLRGTMARWQNVKMSKEIQSACLAHLGAFLHQRSQDRATSDSEDEENLPSTASDGISDVPENLIRREIKRYLEQQDLFSEAERSIQAELFLELARVEAGLIVERGIDKHNNPLFGFVHRTFQEYFAAVDVYERYHQENDQNILSNFLSKHLHDPHWHEVILLLFGKLRSKTASIELRRILEGNSRLSRYHTILQQDLLFACSCLVEEIAIENKLAESIISQAGHLLSNSPYPTQRRQMANMFSLMLQTRQYASIARRELSTLPLQHRIPDTTTSLRADQKLHQFGPSTSVERLLAGQALIQIYQQPGLPVEQVIAAVQAVYKSSPESSGERQQATQLLLQYTQRPDLTIEQDIAVAQALYESSTTSSKEEQQATQLLSQLAQRPDLSIEQAIAVAQALYQSSSLSSEEERKGFQLLFDFAQNQKLTPDQQLKAALMPLKLSWTVYSDKIKVLRIVLKLLPGDSATRFISEHWSTSRGIKLAHIIVWV